MAITQNITLDDLLDMSITEFEDAISSISKAELNKVEIVLSDYARQTSARNMLENKVALKLNYIKNAKTVKKYLKKVIAKVQEESKQESTQAPKNDKAQKPRNSSLNGISIKNSPNTPRNSGVNYNYQKGQGDFFGKSSAFKFIKEKSDNNQPDTKNDNQADFDFSDKIKKTRKKTSEKINIIKVSIAQLEPKALKQFKDILKMPNGTSKVVRQSANSNAPKGTVHRDAKSEGGKQADGKRTAGSGGSSKIPPKQPTQYELEKLALKSREAGIREKHIDAIKDKPRSAQSLVELKARLEQIADERKQKQKASELQAKTDIKTTEETLKNSNRTSYEIVRQNGKARSAESRQKFKYMEAQNSRDIANDKKSLQLQRAQLSRSHQMHRDMHGIHPALGMMYGIGQSRKENSQNNQEGGGGIFSGILGDVLGTVVGGALALKGGGMLGKGGGGKTGKGGGGKMGTGGMLKGLSAKRIKSNTLKLGASKLPIVGAAVVGIAEGMSTGSVGKGLAAGAGQLVGSALGGAIGFALAGPPGAWAGAFVGSWLGTAISDMVTSDKFGLKLGYTLPIEAIMAKSALAKIESNKNINPTLNNPTDSGNKTGAPNVGGGVGFGQNNANKNVKQVPNPNNPQSASGKIRKSGDVQSDADLLAFISQHEGKDYDTIYGGGKADLSNMTLKEAQEFQANSKNFPNGGKSRAIGKYQFTTKPLEEEIAFSGLDPNTAKFTPEIQDKLILQRLKRSRGLDSASPEELALNLAKEFASLPVTRNMQGANRKVKKGESYYAGDGLNKSLMTPEELSKGVESYKNPKSKISSLQESTNRVQEKSMEDKSKPINVINVGGSSGGSSNVTNNTYVNPVNTDATPRQLANNMMYPGRLV